MSRHHRANLANWVLASGVALVTLAALTGPSRADFANCAAPGFFDGVDDRMSGLALPCDEAVRFSIETPVGTRQVRIVYSTADLSPGLLGFVSDIRRGIEQAAVTLRGIGEGDTADITIWASDLPAIDDDIGIADAIASPLGAIGSECVVALYPGGDSAYIAAHEFFHCVQFTTYGAKTLSGSSGWWAEGSAEWFASLSFPGRSASDGDVAVFDSVSRDTPLTSMNQESVVFFFWLARNYGSSIVMALMNAMPDGSSSAQQDALLGLLSAEAFQDFAQDYLDKNITQPGGRTIPSDPFMGDVYVWVGSGDHTLRAERFVLARFQLEIVCGEWTVERQDEKGTWKVSRDDGPWEEMSDSLTIDGPDPDEYRVAAFGTDPEGFEVTIELNRTPCRQCVSVPVDDDIAACLIGRWELVSGGYGEQIQQRLEAAGLFERIEYPDLESVLVINADGTFEFPGPPEDYNVEVQTPGGDMFVGIGTLSVAGNGFWSIDNETLNMCQLPPEVNINLTIIDPDGVETPVEAAGGPRSVIQRSRTFSCAGGALTIIEAIPFTPTVRWEYRRAD